MKKISQDNNINQSILDLIGETSLPNENEEKYKLPVEGRLIGHFAPGIFLNKSHPKGHDGVDILASQSTPIHPIGSGICIEVKNYPKGGHTCKISHENGGVESYYAHMESVKVSVGEKVTQESVIGTVGKSGCSSYHLHQTCKVNGTLVDPLSIIGKVVGSLSGKKANLIITIQKLANDFLNGCQYKL